jgi:hypothetical protein
MGWGTYLSPPFLSLPWLSALGIPYASWWAFSPVYTVFWVLVALVGTRMASWDRHREVALGDVAAVFRRWSVSECIAGEGYALGVEIVGGYPHRLVLTCSSPGASSPPFSISTMQRLQSSWRLLVAVLMQVMWRPSTQMTWQLCVIGAVAVAAGIVGIVIAVAPFVVVVAVIHVVAADARRRHCHASFVAWCSCAAGFSSANAKDGGGGVLTCGPADVPSGRVVRGRNGGGGGKEGSDVATATGFWIWDDTGRRTESRLITY